MRKLIDEAQRKAQVTLASDRALLDRVAEALLEKETLTAADLERLTGTPSGAHRWSDNGPNGNGSTRAAAGASGPGAANA